MSYIRSTFNGILTGKMLSLSTVIVNYSIKLHIHPYCSMKSYFSMKPADINMHFVHVSQQDYKCLLVNTDRSSRQIRQSTIPTSTNQMSCRETASSEKPRQDHTARDERHLHGYNLLSLVLEIHGSTIAYFSLPFLFSHPSTLLSSKLNANAARRLFEIEMM